MNINYQDETVSIQDEAAALFVLDQAAGFTYAGALRAAASVCVADHLANGPQNASELALATGTDAQKLYRVLRLLVSRGIFEELDDGTFKLTAAGHALRSDSPISVRKGVLMLTDETFWRPSGNFANIIRSADKNPVFREIFGTTFFEHWANKGDLLEDFHDGMSSMSEAENRFLVKSYEFPEGATVVDVAGGFGGLILKVMRDNPSVRGILFDQPHVLSRHRLGELGDDKRWELASGSFFESCPRGDIYMLKYIMHDWSDDDCVRILSNCRKAMSKGGRVLIMDPVIPAKNTPHTGKLFDLLVMAIYDGGRERTEDEFRKILDLSDLRLNRVVDTGSYNSIVEAFAK